MPTIKVSYDDLMKLSGIKMDIDELSDALFMLKTELESVEGDILELSVDDSERPDLWSAEGIARALRYYTGKEAGVWKVEVRTSDYTLRNEEPSSRPYIIAAVVKGVNLGEKGYEQLIQLQEKIMTSYGRKRKRLAVGTSRADKISFPLVYREVDPDSVSFRPLNEDREYTLEEVLRYTEKGREYAHLLEGYKKYPVILDSEGRVVTFPPIINSDDLGRITPETRDIFVDVTGSHLPSMITALNVIVSALVERGGEVYSVEVNGVKYPDLSPREIEVPVERMLKIGGISKEEFYRGIERSGFEIRGNRVVYPAYRGDIRHWRDILEDVLSSINYNTLTPEIPSIFTEGRLNYETAVTDAIRDILVGAGGEEVQTFTLTDPKLFKIVGLGYSIEVENPVSRSHSILRSSLIPGLLYLLSKNTDTHYPQKPFEVGEIYTPERKLAVSMFVAGPEVTYTSARQVFDYLSSKMEWNVVLSETEHPAFIEGRTAKIEGDVRGFIGEVHPRILKELKIYVPVSGFEIILP